MEYYFGGSALASVNYKQIACFLTQDQHDRLKRLSAEALVPMQVILRQAVDNVLADYKRRPKQYRNANIRARVARLSKKGVNR
jgi:hypothetical protein